MKMKFRKDYLLIGLVVFTFIFGLVTISAIGDENKSYSHTIEQKHYSESNCNVDSHYTNGIHYHDVDNCTNVSHNHNGVSSTVVEQKHYSESNCNVDSHYTDGIHYHDIDNCNNINHSHNNSSSHHSNKGHH